MTNHKITVKRSAIGNLSSASLGTDALNAISSIPNVTNVKIEVEGDVQIEISYTYTAKEKFWRIDEHLSKFGLVRVD